MEYSIEVILYPEEAKSKNGVFFENLIRSIFHHQGYDISQNINFTGLEIDLWMEHTISKKKVIVECKAKDKVLSEEVKKFVFNVDHKEADYGYFFYTKELDHQAVGLVKELQEDAKKRYEKLIFLDPKKVIQCLVDSGKIRSLTEIDYPKKTGEVISKKILVYGYFGIYYVLLTSVGSKMKNYYVLNAETIKEENIKSITAKNDIYNSNQSIDEVLKENISELTKIKLAIYQENSNEETHKNYATNADIQEDFLNYLNDPGANYSHPHANDISLEDIFVAPDLVIVDDSKVKKGKTYAYLNDVITPTSKGIKLVFLGEELSGKTSICKYIYMQYYSQGYLPILLTGEDIGKKIRYEDILKIIERKFIDQYICAKPFKEIFKEKIILIFDDFHKLTVSSKYKQKLIKNIEKITNNVIFMGNLFMPLHSLDESPNSKNSSTEDVDGAYLFENYELYRISQLGVKLRTTLAMKWNRLGSEQTYIDTYANDFLRKDDESIRYIDSVIGKNYVPSYPSYVLLILQARETTEKGNNNYSLHGFYYERIIDTALNKALKSCEIDISKYIGICMNFITMYCYELFCTKKKILTPQEFDEFYQRYSEKYNVLSKENLLKVFYKSKLLAGGKNQIFIPYKYIYYFFTAKYLSDNIAKSEIKEIISKMSQRVYNEDFGGIIMFLTHLSKDEFVIQELLDNAKKVFENFSVAHLENDIDRINELIKELPKEVIKSIDEIDVEKERLKEAGFVDKEKNEEGDGFWDSNLSSDEDLDKDTSLIDAIAKVNLAMKTIEILGELLKKYWGYMAHEKIEYIIIEICNTGLRMLNFYLTFVDDNKPILIEYVEKVVLKKHLRERYKMSDYAEKVSNDFVFRLCFLFSYGIIKRISYSLGFEKIMPAFKKILANKSSNAMHLINIALKLDFGGSFPMKDVESQKNKFIKKYLPFLILRNLVIEHLYMFHTTFQEKSQIASMFNFEIKGQEAIDIQSKEKKRKNK